MTALGDRLARLTPFLGTIRVRLTVWYVALLALCLVGFSAFLYFSLSRSLFAQMDRALAAEGRQMNAEVDVDRGPQGDELEFEGEDDELEPGVLVALYDLAGTRIFASDPNYLPPGPVGPALTRAIEGEHTISTVTMPDGGTWRVLTRPATYKARTVGVLQVARSQREVEATLDSLGRLLAVALPLMLVPAVAGGLFLAGRALNPIDRIVRTAETISADDLSQRLNVPASADELGRLVATFDRMLDRLERAFQRQRQFTADAAHELRTPLALLASQADLALARPRAASEYQAALESIRADTARLSQLLADLLVLARAEAGHEPLVSERLDLTALADDVIGAMAPLAESRGVRLAVTNAEHAVVLEADQTRLTQLLVNLLDNGIKYTPAGGMVTVSVTQRSDGPILRVADTGVGIPAEHLPHVFERFYRVDKARSQAEGGAGMGLAICQWIVRAHGGDIRVESQPGLGTTFTVRLPARPANSATPPPPPRSAP
jgi:heavy metal sensor kinase